MAVQSADATSDLRRLGRDEAATVLIRREHGRLVTCARLLVEDLPTAEDVVQGALAGLHRHWAGLVDEHAALRYLRTAVVNGPAARWGGGGPPAPGVRPGGAPSDELLAVHRDDCRRLLCELSELPQRQREVLVLRSYLDLSEAQIADELATRRTSRWSSTGRCPRGRTGARWTWVRAVEARHARARRQG